MNYSVGILYSTGEFLQDINHKPISMIEFKSAFEKYGVANTESILEISQKCNWIEIDDVGMCHLSVKGLIIVNESNIQIKLRAQLKDVIEYYQPAWIHRMKNGRTEIKDYLPTDVRQIFKEAGLFEPWDDELIRWWDILTHTAYSIDSAQKLKIGRTAESNTIKFEQERTHEKPSWVSLESNNLGYDVLSRVSNQNKDAKRIEVKGTKLSLKEAHFYLTRHEWEIGNVTSEYYLYLWVLRKPLYVIPVPFNDVAKHAPKDQLRGKWTHVKIPFKPFRKLKVAIKGEKFYTA